MGEMSVTGRMDGRGSASLVRKGQVRVPTWLPSSHFQLTNTELCIRKGRDG